MEEIQQQFPNLTKRQKSQLSNLKSLYEIWNGQINVISRKDLDSFYTHHVLHSLAISKVIDFKDNTSILDVGTGGGFPAIPLAIIFPNIKILAVDSIGKKIKVVKAIAESLELKNLKAEHKRAEEVDEKFDFIVSRAVTRTNRFIPWVSDKFRKENLNDLANGFLFLKGGNLKEEMNEVNYKYKEFNISDFFKDEFFITKKVIYLTK